MRDAMNEDEDVGTSGSLALEIEGVVTGALVRPDGRPGRLETHRGEVDRRRARPRLLS